MLIFHLNIPPQFSTSIFCLNIPPQYSTSIFCLNIPPQYSASIFHLNILHQYSIFPFPFFPICVSNFLPPVQNFLIFPFVCQIFCHLTIISIFCIVCQICCRSGEGTSGHEPEGRVAPCRG